MYLSGMVGNCPRGHGTDGRGRLASCSSQKNMKKSRVKIPRYVRVKAKDSKYREHAKVLEKIINWHAHKDFESAFEKLKKFNDTKLVTK